MNEKLLDSWTQALKRYADNEIVKAGQKAMEDCSKMPTPYDVISRIVKQEEVFSEEYKLIQGSCSMCGRKSTCILEDPYEHQPRCRECYTGLSVGEYKAKMRDLIKIVSESPSLADRPQTGERLGTGRNG
jgi:hypothetical protein